MKDVIKRIKQRASDWSKLPGAIAGKTKAERALKNQRNLSAKNLTKHIGEYPFGWKNQKTIHDKVKKLINEGKSKEALGYTKDQMMRSGSDYLKELVQKNKVKFRD